MPAEEITDETIMERVRQGELSELSELFERYHVKLYNFFLKLTGDRQVSEDLTQNLFYRVIRYRQSFDQRQGSFRSWVYQTARNIHNDHLKEQKKSAGHNKPFLEDHLQVAEPQSGYQEEHFDKLNFALSQLKADQRELLLLSRFEGLKYEEISRLNGKSVLAIRVMVHRAIQNLKTIYFNQP